jgi:purine-binding chemotaxis protein CheW
MNLADIRKKALQEKSAVQNDRVPARPRPVMEMKDDIPAPGGTVAGNAVSVGSDATAQAAEPKKLPIVFDPLAIILAGRQAIGHSLDSTTEPASDGHAEKRISRKYICFRVATEEYAINLMDIKEVIKPREITEVPHAPGFLPGIISLRGIIVPVFDMQARLGFERSTSSGKERIIIVRKQDGCCGLLVDEVFQVVTLEQQPIESPPTVLEGTDREFISGIGRHGEHMSILVDLEKILDVTLQ